MVMPWHNNILNRKCCSGIVTTDCPTNTINNTSWTFGLRSRRETLITMCQWNRWEQQQESQTTTSLTNSRTENKVRSLHYGIRCKRFSHAQAHQAHVPHKRIRNKLNTTTRRNSQQIPTDQTARKCIQREQYNIVNEASSIPCPHPLIR